MRRRRLMLPRDLLVKTQNGTAIAIGTDLSSARGNVVTASRDLITVTVACPMLDALCPVTVIMNPAAMIGLAKSSGLVLTIAGRLPGTLLPPMNGLLVLPHVLLLPVLLRSTPKLVSRKVRVCPFLVTLDRLLRRLVLLILSPRSVLPSPLARWRTALGPLLRRLGPCMSVLDLLLVRESLP